MSSGRLYRTYGLTSKEIDMLSEMSEYETNSMSAIVRDSIVRRYRIFKREKDEEFNL